MARITVQVQLNGKTLNALLDTGAWRSYIRRDIATHLPTVTIEPFQVKLGGNVLNIRQGVIVEGIVSDTSGRSYRFAEKLFPADSLGEEAGAQIDIVFGAVILEDWGALINEATKPPSVDYVRLRKGQLVEL